MQLSCGDDFDEWWFASNKLKIKRKMKIGDLEIKALCVETPTHFDDVRVEVFNGESIFRVDTNMVYLSDAFKVVVRCVRWVGNMPISELPLHTAHKNDLVKILVAKRLEGSINLEENKPWWKVW